MNYQLSLAMMTPGMKMMIIVQLKLSKSQWLFFSIKIIDTQGIVSNYLSSDDDKDIKLESDIQELSDDKRDFVMKKEVPKTIKMKPKILNQKKLNVATTINTLNTISENKTFKKILNTPTYCGHIKIDNTSFLTA